MVYQFQELGLQDQFVQAVRKMGFVEPTPIQQAAIPALLAGRDVIGQAQTGTGKTAAFMLPLLQGLNPSTHSVQALVLAPTRELAKQVADAASQLGQETSVRILAVYGGQSYTIQKRALGRGVDVVVGTPGRLLDLIRQNELDLSQVSYLVIDEADEMLEMGFVDDVESILKELSADRQIALFSATMPDAIRKLANRYLNSPEKISVNPEQITVAETTQRFYRVREENKMAALIRLLEVEDIDSGLIFVRTKVRSQEIADELSTIGFPADALNGDLNQARREQVLERFRQHSLKILVATDVAARGLDIDDVTHVINYDFPQDAEDYVHRIGRTGRAGKSGVAISLITSRERGIQKQVIAYTKQPVEECVLPTVEEVEKRREERLLQKLSDQLIVGVSPAERKLVEQFGEQGLTPIEIAVAAIRFMRATESKLKAIEIKEPVHEERYKHLEERRSQGNRSKGNWSDRDERRSPKGKGRGRGSDAGMVRLWMNLGNKNGIRPSDVVGAIASEVGIPGKAIGAIEILADHTFVDISEQHVHRVLKESTGKYQLRGQAVLLRLADHTTN
ncbi:MAG: DEAD/DEAH box helicase [Anaerolineaceae bacterium]|nr:DEAD/DEAH box helicase [Anaerolineaceae bacterium]